MYSLATGAWSTLSKVAEQVPRTLSGIAGVFDFVAVNANPWMMGWTAAILAAATATYALSDSHQYLLRTLESATLSIQNQSQAWQELNAINRQYFGDESQLSSYSNLINDVSQSSTTMLQYRQERMRYAAEGGDSWLGWASLNLARLKRWKDDTWWTRMAIDGGNTEIGRQFLLAVDNEYQKRMTEEHGVKSPTSHPVIQTLISSYTSAPADYEKPMWEEMANRLNAEVKAGETTLVTAAQLVYLGSKMSHLSREARDKLVEAQALYWDGDYLQKYDETYGHLSTVFAHQDKIILQLSKLSSATPSFSIDHIRTTLAGIDNDVRAAWEQLDADLADPNVSKERAFGDFEIKMKDVEVRQNTIIQYFNIWWKRSPISNKKHLRNNKNNSRLNERLRQWTS